RKVTRVMTAPAAARPRNRRRNGHGKRPTVGGFVSIRTCVMLRVRELCHLLAWPARTTIVGQHGRPPDSGPPRTLRACLPHYAERAFSERRCGTRLLVVYEHDFGRGIDVLLGLRRRDGRQE